MDPFDDDLDLDSVDLDLLEDYDELEDLLDAALDSPTDFDEHLMNEDDCS